MKWNLKDYSLAEHIRSCNSPCLSCIKKKKKPHENPQPLTVRYFYFPFGLKEMNVLLPCCSCSPYLILFPPMVIERGCGPVKVQCEGRWWGGGEEDRQKQKTERASRKGRLSFSWETCTSPWVQFLWTQRWELYWSLAPNERIIGI